jgi:enoyl-[acyl-carrier-protein] reductase (NADH)
LRARPIGQYPASRMAVYLASDESAITTGQVLSVVSGVSIR